VSVRVILYYYLEILACFAQEFGGLVGLVGPVGQVGHIASAFLCVLSGEILCVFALNSIFGCGYAVLCQSVLEIRGHPHGHKTAIPAGLPVAR